MKIRNFPQFTHFACLPFIQDSQRNAVFDIQKTINQIVHSEYQSQAFAVSNHKLSHITISMLLLHREDARQKMTLIMDKLSEQLRLMLKDIVITFKKVSYFSKFNPKTKKSQVTLLYLEIEKDQNLRKIEKAGDLFIRQMLKADIITAGELKQMRIAYNFNQNIYKNQQNHLTLFRVKNVIDDQKFQSIFKQISQLKLGNPFHCYSFDISTRNHYSQNNKFYAPFYSIKLSPQQQKNVVSHDNNQIMVNEDEQQM